jgi:site-specific DNA-methyltransferase (adenine-specific)
MWGPLSKKMLERNRIYCMDAIEGMKKMDAESVDLVVTDPPFNIASKSKLTIRGGKLVSTMEAFGAWDHFHPFDYDILIMQVISQCYRMLKKGGSMYMFTARENSGFFIRHAVARGFTYRNQLALVKTPQLPSFSKTNWRSGYELCMYLTKGPAKTFNFLSQRELVNVHTYWIGQKKTKHPTEKPLEFTKRLVQVSSNAGDLVLDPFMGSGTTAAACVETGRDYIGFERDQGYVRMARQRLKVKGGGACTRNLNDKTASESAA